MTDLTEMRDESPRQRRVVVQTHEATRGIDGLEDVPEVELQNEIRVPQREPDRVLDREVGHHRRFLKDDAPRERKAVKHQEEAEQGKELGPVWEAWLPHLDQQPAASPVHDCRPEIRLEKEYMAHQ